MSQYVSERWRQEYAHTHLKTNRLGYVFYIGVSIFITCLLSLAVVVSLPIAIMAGALVFLALVVVDSFLQVISEPLAKWLNRRPKEIPTAVKSSADGSSDEQMSLISAGELQSDKQNLAKLPQPISKRMFAFARSAPSVFMVSILASLLIVLSLFFIMGIAPWLTAVIFFAALTAFLGLESIASLVSEFWPQSFEDNYCFFPLDFTVVASLILSAIIFLVVGPIGGFSLAMTLGLSLGMLVLLPVLNSAMAGIFFKRTAIDRPERRDALTGLLSFVPAIILTAICASLHILAGGYLAALFFSSWFATVIAYIGFSIVQHEDKKYPYIKSLMIVIGLAGPVIAAIVFCAQLASLATALMLSVALPASLILLSLPITLGISAAIESLLDHLAQKDNSKAVDTGVDLDTLTLYCLPVVSAVITGLGTGLLLGLLHFAIVPTIVISLTLSVVFMVVTSADQLSHYFAQVPAADQTLYNDFSSAFKDNLGVQAFCDNEMSLEETIFMRCLLEDKNTTKQDTKKVGNLTDTKATVKVSAGNYQLKAATSWGSYLLKYGHKANCNKMPQNFLPKANKVTEEDYQQARQRFEEFRQRVASTAS